MQSRPTPRPAAADQNALLAAVASLALTGLVLPGTVPNAAAASCGTTNLALNQTATASSIQNASFPAQDAVDGNLGTRWSSAFSDPHAGGRPGLHPVHLPGGTELGNAYATRPDPDLTGRAPPGPRSTPPPPAPAAPRPSA